MPYPSDRPLTIASRYTWGFVLLAVFALIVWLGSLALLGIATLVATLLAKVFGVVLPTMSHNISAVVVGVLAATFLTLFVHHLLNDGRYLLRDASISGIGGSVLWLGFYLEYGREPFLFFGQPYFGYVLAIIGAIALAASLMEPASPTAIKYARDNFPKRTRKRQRKTA